MSRANATHQGAVGADGVPIPIVRLTRWMLVLGVSSAFVAQQPALLTLLFVLLVPGVLFGQRWSPIMTVGRWLFGARLAEAEREDRRVMRFNNLIALFLLGAAQGALVLGATVLGWLLALLVAGAAAVALAGFCIGCFLYYQYQLQRYRLLGK